MSLASPLSCYLVRHLQTDVCSVDTINVRVESTTNALLALTFILQGDLATLRIPAERPCVRVDELWRHTCFEAFLMAGDGPEYKEYNFSPSGEWAVYTFSDYRQASVTADESAPLIQVQQNAQHLMLKTEIPLEQPPLYRSIRLGLSAVVEADDGSLSYWALRHPPGKPDFHHIDAFDLQLD